MGLADFLVEAGQGTGAERIGRAMGGTNRRADDFFNNTYKPFVEAIHANTDENQIRPLGEKFVGDAIKAGVPLKGAEDLLHLTIGPALEGIRQEGLNKLFNQYAGQPAVPGESRPQGTEGPLTPSGNFIDPKAATPDKPLDLNFIGKFGQLTGANPQQFNQMLSTPADIAGKQISNQKTQQAIDAEAAAQKEISGLSNTPAGPGQPSLQSVARINRPGIVQFIPPRNADLQSQMLDLKQQQLTNTTDNAAARLALEKDKIDLARQKQDTSGDKPMTDAQLHQQYQKAVLDREKMRRGDLNPASWFSGQTEGYNAADANVNALEGEMKKRGLLPGGAGPATSPTPPTPNPGGRGGKPTKRPPAQQPSATPRTFEEWKASRGK